MQKYYICALLLLCLNSNVIIAGDSLSVSSVASPICLYRSLSADSLPRYMLRAPIERQATLLYEKDETPDSLQQLRSDLVDASYYILTKREKDKQKLNNHAERISILEDISEQQRIIIVNQGKLLHALVTKIKELKDASDACAWDLSGIKESLERLQIALDTST